MNRAGELCTDTTDPDRSPPIGMLVIGGVAFVRAMRRMIRALKQGHIDILTRNVLNRRVGRLAQRQCVAGVGNDASIELDDDARRVSINTDRMIWAGNLDRFVGHSRHL